MYKTIIVLGISLVLIGCEPDSVPTSTPTPTNPTTPAPTSPAWEVGSMSIEEYIDWKIKMEKDLSETLANFTQERKDRNETLADLNTLDVITTRIFHTPAPDRFADSHGYFVVSAEYLDAFVEVARDVMVSEEPTQEQLDMLQSNIDSFREYRQISKKLFNKEIPEGSNLLGD